MTPEQFVRLLARNDIEGYDWLNSVTKFDLDFLSGAGAGSSDWFAEHEFQFWYNSEVITYKNEFRVEYNVYETTIPGSAIKKEGGSDLWFTTRSIPIKYIDLCELYDDDDEGNQIA